MQASPALIFYKQDTTTYVPAHLRCLMLHICYAHVCFPPLCCDEIASHFSLTRHANAISMHTFKPSISSKSEGSRFCICFASFTPSSKAAKASAAVQATTLTLYRTRDAAPITTYGPSTHGKLVGAMTAGLLYSKQNWGLEAMVAVQIVLYSLACGSSLDHTLCRCGHARTWKCPSRTGCTRGWWKIITLPIDSGVLRDCRE